MHAALAGRQATVHAHATDVAVYCAPATKQAGGQACSWCSARNDDTHEDSASELTFVDELKAPALASSPASSVMPAS